MGKRLTNEQIDDMIKDTQCVRISEYVNTITKIKFRCINCGACWLTTPARMIYRGLKGCKKCNISSGAIKRRKSDTHIDSQLADKPVLRLTPYKGCHTKISWKCLICDYEWCARPNDVLSGHLCAVCSGRRLTNSIIDQRLIGRGIERVGEFSTTRGKIAWRCIHCDNEWVSSTSNVINIKTGCPVCKSSKGEKEISRILQLLSVKYKQQKWFCDCVNPMTNRVLYFDFFLPDYNMCIEFDGSQHYTPDYPRNDKIEALRKFESLKSRDLIKNNYCEFNAIVLIRIPYWEFKNIEQIIRKALS